MDILLMFILFCYGIAATLAVGKIFQPVREWVKERSEWGYKFIKCPMCLSFWIGLITTQILSGYPDLMYIPTPIHFYNAFIAVAGSFILHALVWRLALKDKDF